MFPLRPLLFPIFFLNEPPAGRGRSPPLGQPLETQKGGAESIYLNTAGFPERTHGPKTTPHLKNKPRAGIMSLWCNDSLLC